MIWLIVLLIISTAVILGQLFIITDSWKYYSESKKLKKLLITVLMGLLWISIVSITAHKSLSLFN